MAAGRPVVVVGAGRAVVAAEIARSSWAGGGGGGGGGGEADSGAPARTASYVVSVEDNRAITSIFTESTLNVTIAPNGFSGAVTLSVVGLPTNVDIITNGTLSIDGSTSATTALKLTTHTSTKPGNRVLDRRDVGGGDDVGARDAHRERGDHDSNPVRRRWPRRHARRTRFAPRSAATR